MARSAQECLTCLEWQEIEVPSSDTSSNRTYTVSVPPWDEGDTTCECPSFTHRGWCRHTAVGLRKLCRWSSFASDVPQTDEQANGHICPRCGGPTVLVEE
jgi:hypothetical protein